MISPVSTPLQEASERFQCFGGDCMVVAEGRGAAGSANDAARRAKHRLLEWQAQFSRFEPASELSQLNNDTRGCVPVSAMMLRFVDAALWAASTTGGLVDPTLVSEVEQAGYATDFSKPPVPPELAARLTPEPRPAGPNPAARWRLIDVDHARGQVTRPVGTRLDSGGVAKGLFGDVLAAVLGSHESFAVAAAGDVRFGGAAGKVRPIQVASPFEPDAVLHTFEGTHGAVATSGVTRRRWIDERGLLAHHLLDPATGAPAFTGVLQATALAPSGVEAEALAKAAVLAGAQDASGWLRHGGVIVFDGGRVDVIEPAVGVLA